MASSPASSYDCSFKVLLIGDSAVGKSSLLVSFVSAAHLDDDIAPTIGVDFKIKFLTDEDRVVTREEGIAFAQEYGCLFLESSAKTRENVEKCFEELALKILEVPSLLEEGSSVVKRNSLKQKQENANQSGSCCQ
nr:unnamed protein product [Digitaria exilis]